ncbi:MAG: mannose-1-phosphate guanylyltransferase [Caulobacterales bacterium 32-69-10]|nr:MAG: mannose-1-phosphate guanylyltransferase [Caulobacterales bacterium 32-69-10]
MILAAGNGTRMKPLTDDRPKALIEVADKALIDHVLDRLEGAGVETAVVNVHAFADRLEAHLAHRKHPKIVISDERSALLETGGGLKKARSLLGDAPVLVANIDSIWIDDEAPAFGPMAHLWDPEKMDVLLLLARMERSVGFDGPGDFFLQPDGRLTFRGEAAAAPYAYMGLHITKPQVVDDGPDGAFSLAAVWRRLAEQGRLYGVVMEGTWMHVGDPVARGEAETLLLPGGP